MKRFIILFFICIFSIPFYGQNTVKGLIINDTGKKLQKVSIQIKNTKFITFTDKNGFFKLENISDGEHLISVEKNRYETQSFPITMSAKEIDLKQIILYENNEEEEEEEEEEDYSVIVISDDELSADTNSADNISGLLQSSKDTYLKAAAFEWSSSFYKIKGLGSENGKVLINGIEMNKIFNDRPQWSNWGGANDLLRNQEASIGLSPVAYSFGGTLGTTNISTRASEYRKGGSVSYASSNRSYRNRLMVSYKSGLLENGWSFALLMSKRLSNEGFVEGTRYEANTLMESMEKNINDKHSISFTLIYAQNKRGKAGPNTQEVFSLKGIKYNPYWGNQKDSKRNSRIKRIEEPIIMLNHYWDVSNKLSVNTNVGYQFGEMGNSRLNYNGVRLLPDGSIAGGASNPDPTHYTKLPSYAIRNGNNNAYDLLKDLQSDGQIDWNSMYLANLNGYGNAKYMLYEDRVDDKSLTVNSIISYDYNDNIRLNGKLRYVNLESDNFATPLDLLGGNYYLDVDAYADTFEEQQNNLKNPNRQISLGDKFGYHYKFNSTKMNAFVQGVFNYKKVDFYLAGDFSNTTHQRNGLFQNGAYKDTSFGDSEKIDFINLSGKGGATYKINGRHLIDFNGGYISKAPNLRNAFANSRENNKVTDGLVSEKLLSFDTSYILRMPKIQAKVTGYYANNSNKTENGFYYADGINGDTKEFVQASTTGISTQHIGVELGVQAQVTSRMKVKAASNFGQYTYADDAFVTLSSDDVDFSFDKHKTYLKNYKVAAGPQKTYSIGLEYRHPEYWWFSITGNYFDDTYVGLANIRRTDNFKMDSDGTDFIDYNEEEAKNLLKQERFDSYFTVNIVGGKSWKLKNGHYIGCFVSVSNLLNNEFKTGGFEQSRTANFKTLKADQSLETPIFSNKYWYARGASYFANISYRF